MRRRPSTCLVASPAAYLAILALQLPLSSGYGPTPWTVPRRGVVSMGCGGSVPGWGNRLRRPPDYRRREHVQVANSLRECRWFHVVVANSLRESFGTAVVYEYTTNMTRDTRHETRVPNLFPFRTALTGTHYLPDVWLDKLLLYHECFDACLLYTSPSPRD